MSIHQVCYNATSWGSLKKSDLKKVWFINILNGVGFLSDSSGNGIHPYRSPSELFDDSHQQFMVDMI
jgi:hypothetical protein